MNDAPDPATRYHAFDALRASMMMLGVLLHACQFYLTTPLFPTLDYRDLSTSTACDVAFFSIHAFRMQAFFAMAGFFAALICARRGVRGLWANRLRRVGLPLLLGWPILFVPTISAFIYGCARRAGEPGWQSVSTWWSTGDFPWVEDWNPIYNLFLVTPLHLWFLYALLWFYLATTAVLWLGRRGGGAVARAAHRAFRGLARWHLLLPASIALSTLMLLPNPSGLFAQEFPLFIPNPLPLLAFGPFFGFGWMLYRNVDLLPALGMRPLPTLAAAAAAMVWYFDVLGRAFATPGENPIRFQVALAGSTVAWLCVFGLIGLFLRYFDRPSPTTRYLSDSAYWVYLAHLPLVYAMHGLLFDLPLPALAKVAIILLVAVPLLLASYNWLVRPGRVGRFLHGRSHPPARPWAKPAQADPAFALELDPSVPGSPGAG